MNDIPREHQTSPPEILTGEQVIYIQFMTAEFPTLSEGGVRIFDFGHFWVIYQVLFFACFLRVKHAKKEQGQSQHRV